MKLTGIILLAGCLQLSARGLTQTVTISVKDAPLLTVLKAIEKQTSYVFFVDNQWLQKAKRVTITASNVPLQKVLDECFKDQPLTYTITGKVINITPKEEKASTVDQLSTADPGDVRGRVVNENGEPVQASVSVKGTTVGTTTNDNGEFLLKGIDENSVLVFSGVGLETTEVRLNGKKTLNVTVKIDIAPLQETVIKGYYTTTSKLNTGNVTKITAAEIQKQPINNPLLAIAGRIPGVIISQNSGLPGGGINIQIRGQNSLRVTANEPLYVIDGVPYGSQLLPNLGNDVLQQTNGNFAAGGGNPLSYINPNDIESISVLKDADATAIYGSRGANGVVLITTKKGNIGKSKVNLNFATGIGNVSKKIDLLYTPQYLEMRHKAFLNDGDIPNAGNAPDLFSYDTTRYTDWQKVLLGRTAKYTNAQASISGGDKNIQYLIGGTFFNETTVFPGNFSDKKGAIHFNLNTVSSNDRFKTTFSGNYNVSNRTLPTTDFTLQAFLLPPNAPEIYNPDGSLNWANSTWPGENPLVSTQRLYNTKTSNLLSNLNLSYHLLKGLDINTSLGYTKMGVKEISTFPMSTQDPGIYSSITGSSSFTDNTVESWIIEPKLSYKLSSRKSQFDALIGGTWQMNNSNGNIVDATGYTSDELLKNIQAASIRTIRSVTNSVYKYNAAFARLGYSYSSKYVLNFTARRDGSSRFGDNNKFHNFGSVGLAWIFKEESFLKNRLTFISFGKLKGSYGTTGNDQIGDYKFYDLYTPNQYTYQGTSNLIPQNLYNPNLAWEETKKAEIGIDLGLFKNRILLNANYYNNKSSNQLVSYLIPSVTGFSTISANFPATVRNWGYEFYINSTNLKAKNFTWTSMVNITIPKNKLVDFPNIENTPYNTTLVVGEPITIKRVYQVSGVNDTTGVYQFINSKGALTYNPSSLTDKTQITNTAAKFYGGVGNTLSYYGFQLDFFFQFVKQIGRNFIYQKAQPFGNFYAGNQSTEVLNNWQKMGDETTIQRFTANFISNAFNAYQFIQESDYAYTDASFIRLKNVSLSYQFPSKWIQQAKIRDCKMYLQGQNILTITNYNGLDPESTSGLYLPPLRVITIGLNVTI